MIISKRYLALTGLLMGAAAAHAQVQEDRYDGEAKDAWIAGKIESVLMLNRHLNNFEIDTEVENGTVTLTGAVESDIDRDLAGSLAAGVDGVENVENELRVAGATARTAAREPDAGADDRDGRTFGGWVDDATTTAAVKSKLVADDDTKGLEIDVDTRDNVVTLSGRVASNDESAAAERIALATGDVESVRNNLVVDPE
jgi:osmotically-inducible protein OsmY